MLKNKLRLYRETDCMELIQLFYDTIQTVNRKDYSEEQINAWASNALNYSMFSKKFSENPTVIIEAAGEITGFGVVTKQGYFDSLFVHKDWQRQGIGTTIANNIETYTKSNNVNIMTVRSSKTALPFFENRGYKILKQENITIKNQTLASYDMQKNLVTEQSKKTEVEQK